MVTSIIQGPLELLIGTGFGLVYGIIAAFLPHELDFYVVTLRTLHIAFGSLLSFFGSYAIGYSGAGVMGCICLAFVANFNWRRQGWYRYNPVRENYKLAWKFFEPISFSLIGMEIDFQKLYLHDLLLGSVVMLAGALAHFFVATITLKCFKTFTCGQVIFIAIGTVAKATVQAALGPLALDFVRETGTEEQNRDPNCPDPILSYANSILAVSVASIVITSPLCTILLLKIGPKLIPKEDTDHGKSFGASKLVLLTEPDKIYRDEHRRRSEDLLEQGKNKEVRR